MEISHPKSTKILRKPMYERKGYIGHCIFSDAILYSISRRLWQVSITSRYICILNSFFIDVRIESVKRGIDAMYFTLQNSNTILCQSVSKSDWHFCLIVFDFRCNAFLALFAYFAVGECFAPLPMHLQRRDASSKFNYFHLVLKNWKI